MKQILLLLSLFLSFSVNAQKKIVINGGGGGAANTIAGQAMNKTGDSLNLGGAYDENILIHSDSGKNFLVRSGEEGDSLSLLIISKYAASIESVRDAGQAHAQIVADYSNGVSLSVDDTYGRPYVFQLKADEGLIVTTDSGTYYLPHPEANIENKIMIGNSSNRFVLVDIDSIGGGGSASNFPTINDTLASDTSRLTLTGTGRAEIGGAFVNLSVAGDEIKFTSTLVENTITTTDQSFRTGSATENGRLYITLNYAQLSARNAGGQQSSFTAYRNWAQISAPDSFKIVGLQTAAPDVNKYVVVIDSATNKIYKTKRHVLQGDSTVTLTDSSITVNRSAVLGYKEIEGIIKSDGSFILLRSDLGGDWEVKGEDAMMLTSFDGYIIYAKDSIEVTDTYLDFDPLKTTVYISNNVHYDGSVLYSYIAHVEPATVPSTTPAYIKIDYNKDMDPSLPQPFVAHPSSMSVLIRIYE